MRIIELETEGFRMLADQKIEFCEGTNIILGANAQGKTTLLEAAYLMTGAPSFRARYDRELIRFDGDMTIIRGKVESGGREQKIELRIRRGTGRRSFRNGVKSSSAELGDVLRAVIFSPDDLQLVRGGPGLRRQQIDRAIGQLRPGYARRLTEYERVLEQKRAILRGWHEKASLLEMLEEYSAALCAASVHIIRARASYVRRLGEEAGRIHGEFTDKREELRLRYRCGAGIEDAEAPAREIYEKLYTRQAELRQAELDSGLCLVGAHRDEMEIEVSGREARAYASQGQARTAAISVKLAEREILEKETEESPILLLDDVLSELDAGRRSYLLHRLGGSQTLITSCEETELGPARYYLKGGKVYPTFAV
ncbi:MAG: DNA replication/repair protein RecF [Eubacteriales bacterium]|nr:DNA replication/repair protein RecF [Eubacteriales bacterium]